MHSVIYNTQKKTTTPNEITKFRKLHKYFGAQVRSTKENAVCAICLMRFPQHCILIQCFTDTGMHKLLPTITNRFNLKTMRDSAIFLLLLLFILVTLNQKISCNLWCYETVYFITPGTNNPPVDYSDVNAINLQRPLLNCTWIVQQSIQQLANMCFIVLHRISSPSANEIEMTMK